MKDTIKARAELQKAAESATTAIATAAESATKAIASAAESAARVLSVNAAEQSKLVNAKAEGDHDLLIRLETKMEGLKTDIKEIKDGTAAQIADHEVRINSLETSKTKQNTMMAIGTGLLTLLVSILIYHLFQK